MHGYLGIISSLAKLRSELRGLNDGSVGYVTARRIANNNVRAGIIGRV